MVLYFKVNRRLVVGTTINFFCPYFSYIFLSPSSYFFPFPAVEQQPVGITHETPFTCNRYPSSERFQIHNLRISQQSFGKQNCHTMGGSRENGLCGFPFNPVSIPPSGIPYTYINYVGIPYYPATHAISQIHGSDLFLLRHPPLNPSFPGNPRLD